LSLFKHKVYWGKEKILGNNLIFCVLWPDLERRVTRPWRGAEPDISSMQRGGSARIEALNTRRRARIPGPTPRLCLVTKRPWGKERKLQ
jgi:hypothetical protein